MTRAFRAIFAASILVLSFGVPVAAGPFEDAGAALAGADYATTLRTMYEKGRGVAQDDVEAAKWYRLAANQGHAQTQFNLGVAYTTTVAAWCRTKFSHIYGSTCRSRRATKRRQKIAI